MYWRDASPDVVDLVFVSEECLVLMALVSVTHLVVCAHFKTVTEIGPAVQHDGSQPREQTPRKYYDTHMIATGEVG